MTKEADYKKIIKQHLDMTLPQCLIPELGPVKHGKVRDIYFTKNKVIMLSSDNLSTFDYIMEDLIPYKGIVLNKFAEHAFDQVKDIIPSALISSPDPNVVVQKKLKNIGIEAVVRGYMRGRIAVAYERGERNFCGITLGEGLLSYEKLDKPLFTPTTKYEKSDRNLTPKEVEKMLGKKLAKQVAEKTLALYKRGNELAREKGFILIDTKYEFGVDSKGKLHLIDEMHTPDSSRYCTVKERKKKFPIIQKAMKSGKYANVSELLEKKPKLKLKEYSKQYVRDVVAEGGLIYKDGKIVAEKFPRLTKEQIAETVWRYVNAYENMTGETFDFGSLDIDPRKRIIANLQKAGLIKGGMVIIMAGSDSDMPHVKELQKELDHYNIPHEVHICSAHKQPKKLQEILEYYNESIEPLVIIAVAGGTDALSGTASFHSIHPVISCPPDGLNESCLHNPSGSSNAFIKKPKNAAKMAAQILSTANIEWAEKILEDNKAKVEKLEKAN